MFSGNRDPLGKNSKGVLELLRMYRAIGVRDVIAKFYPGGRHEMLNEVNHAAVTDDIVPWLEKHC